MPISAIDDDKEFAIAWQKRADHRLDGESTTTLQGDCRERVATARNRNQLGTHRLRRIDKRLIPGAPVVEHRFFSRHRRGQRAGS